MKVVAVALALALALGCNAFSLQADAPSQLEHFQVAATMYLNQAKDQMFKALELFEDADYKQFKLKLTESLDNLQKYAETASTSLQPYTNQLKESSQKVGEHITTELEDLNARLEPHRAELRRVAEKHMEEYATSLRPLFSNLEINNQKELDALRQRLQPALEDFRRKVMTNLEETKSKLVPLVETVHGKLTDKLQDLKRLVTPVAEEYKEHALRTAEEVKEKLAHHTGQVKPYVEGLMDRVNSEFVSMYQAVTRALNKE